VRPGRRTKRLESCRRGMTAEELQLLDLGYQVGKSEGHREAMQQIKAVADYARRLLGEE